MSEPSRFLFLTCQVGAEPALRGELTRQWPTFRIAFSRPGFLTFKVPEETYLSPDFELNSVFARAYGLSLGRVLGTSMSQLAEGVWQLCQDHPVHRIHAWERDTAEPGDHDFEPLITAAAIEAATAIRDHCPKPEQLRADAIHTSPARSGDCVLDCILIDPGVWWVGYHRVRSVPSQWPGGLMPLALPTDAVSRAWLKMEEALQWSRLPIPHGARWAEIGSAPGGASQALLARGYSVVGIDPAAMHPTVLAHPQFRHVRRRAPQVPRRAFRKIRWLTADMNVAPNYTLDAIEGIVTHPQVQIRGLLLTLKLPQWGLADHIPEYLERIRRWGYNIVHARQLQHNRREFCVAALQKPFHRKPLTPRST